ncbi:hypothetical protein L227DRAFT_616700 [Lentinus tigrinus ALCF2SS1-6]|uniref:Extracellular membrane protein CFEM domain-containing protein n=1 Tax=Lentinus tigrinus ALCF2SS1-6 TaxID=1328759 RepID=A0A5C2RR52_9APHY|nr:hypothetical protein L227DRAFT_616700 [Lentinus tigrinus ALCF2SS1-6]
MHSTNANVFMLVLVAAAVHSVVGMPSSLEARQSSCTDPCTTHSECSARPGCGDFCLTALGDGLCVSALCVVKDGCTRAEDCIDACGTNVTLPLGITIPVDYHCVLGACEPL